MRCLRSAQRAEAARPLGLHCRCSEGGEAPKVPHDVRLAVAAVVAHLADEQTLDLLLFCDIPTEAFP